MWSVGWNAALRHALDLQGFKFRTVLHEGALTDVYECIRGFKKERLAVKAPGQGYINYREVAIVREITECNLDKYNIVKCYGDIQMFSKEKMLVFEKLDINLERYVVDVQQNKPLPLSCVRDVAKQMNVALMALSRQSIIHADIKPSHIMIVKQSETPFTFKLIDFGSALWAHDASQGFTPGTVGFMSPEIMLGLPFTQSTDVWSLGCVLAYMFLGHSLFDTESEFNTFKAIHELIGQPSDELLDEGMYTSRFYNEIDGIWVLKSPEKTEEKLFTSLDDLKPLSVGVYKRHDPIEREQCVELLKKMLQVNPEDRITLEEIMKHPFITGRYPPKVLKWRPFIPFQKKKEISPLESVNQPSQCPTNTLPSEKPKVSKVQRAKNIFTNIKRNKSINFLKNKHCVPKQSQNRKHSNAN
uniref:Protein kinase domain-containing protein n=1 Tax=Neogobius melanostomus TaxID=47308 RepID=A0A8C6TD88_9GOBI